MGFGQTFKYYRFLTLTVAAYLFLQKIKARLRPLALTGLLYPGLCMGLNVIVSDTSPSSSEILPLYEPLYAHILYDSTQPLRFQARGVFQQKDIQNSARFNPSPIYPAGQGEAIAWIAYTHPTRIDHLIVNVYNSQWQLLQQKSVPVGMQWDIGAVRISDPRPQWVDTLNREQQSSVSRPAEPLSYGWILFIQFLFITIPVYWILQILVFYIWQGRWRKIAAIPLIFSLPLLFYTILALALNSNLWPLMMLFLTPLILILLLGIIVYKKVSSPS